MSVFLSLHPSAGIPGPSAALHFTHDPLDDKTRHERPVILTGVWPGFQYDPGR